MGTLGRRFGGAGLRRGIRGSAAGPRTANLVAPALASSLYVGASPVVTAGTWSGSPVLTYSLEINGVQVVAPGTEAAVEAYVVLIASRALNAIVYEIPNGVVASRVASNTVVVYHPANESPYDFFEFWDNASYITKGATTNIATALDLSGNGNTITSILADGSRPTVGAADAGYGGRDVAVLATLGGMRRTTLTQGARSQPGCAIWGGQVTGGDVARILVGDTALTGLHWGTYDNGALELIGAGGVERSVARTSAKAARLIEYNVDATGVDNLFRNDWTTAVASGDSGDNTLNRIIIGSENAGLTFRMAGKIACFGHFPALDTAAKTRIAGYLNAIYGFAITF